MTDLIKAACAISVCCLVQACATTPTETHVEENVMLLTPHGKHVIIDGYDSRGFKVEGTNTWFVGDAPGMRTQLVEGGVRFLPATIIDERTGEIQSEDEVIAPVEIIEVQDDASANNQNQIDEDPGKSYPEDGEDYGASTIEVSDAPALSEHHIQCLQGYTGITSLDYIEGVRNASSDAYIVEKEDQLWTIAMEIYGHEMLWPLIYEANADAIGKNPNNIKVGQKLTLIPDVDSGAAKSLIDQSICNHGGPHEHS